MPPSDANPDPKPLHLPRTAKLTMHPRDLLDRAACLELDWLDAAYGWRAPFLDTLALPLVVPIVGGIFAAVVALIAWPLALLLEVFGVARELAELIASYGLGALVTAFFGWVAWDDWSSRQPARRERAARDACWGLLVEVLGRCAPHTPDDAQATLELERLDHAAWAWRLRVPVAPYGPTDIAVIEARGKRGAHRACTLTQASGARVAFQPTRTPSPHRWTLDGLPTLAPSAALADHVCAALYPEAARADALPRAALLGEAHASPRSAALEARGAWALRDRPASARLPLTQPSRARWGVELTLKLSYMGLGAALGVAVHAAALYTLWRPWSLASYPEGMMPLVTLMMCPVYWLLLDWKTGLHLLPRWRLRRPNEAPSAAAQATLSLSDGVLALGETQVELRRPFQLSLTQDPSAPEARPRLGVLITQGQGAQTARLSFACEAAPSPALRALPRLASSAPRINADALVNEVWPALAAHASAHGAPLPALSSEAPA